MAAQRTSEDPSMAAIKPSVEAPKPALYQAPTTGVFRFLPPSFVPYAELMRLDRPSGYYAFYWHYAIGITFAACLTPKPPLPKELLILAGYLACWVVIYRGAVCTWNDNVDQEFDRKVARCQFRPIARGAVTTFQGHVFAMAQVVLCGIAMLPCPTAVMAYALLMTIILVVYPFGKRIIDFPQVILGFAFAVPIFLCSAAMNADPLLQHVSQGLQKSRATTYGALCMYGACGLWTIIFDTVYAHQDLQDDIKAGVKSLAVRLGRHTKLGLGILSGIEVALLAASGVFCEFGWQFFVLGCTGTAASLTAMLTIVDLKDPSSCAWWFGPGSRLVGASIVAGLLGHYIMRLS